MPVVLALPAFPAKEIKMSSGIQTTSTYEVGVSGKKKVVFSVGQPWASGALNDGKILYCFYGFRENVSPEALEVARAQLPENLRARLSAENWPTKEKVIELARLNLEREFALERANLEHYKKSGQNPPRRAAIEGAFAALASEDPLTAEWIFSPKNVVWAVTGLGLMANELVLDERFQSMWRETARKLTLTA